MIIADFDECQLQDICGSIQVCHNTVGSYRCECPPGLVDDSGSNCVGKDVSLPILTWLPQVRKWSGNKILQGQGNVWKFYYGSGKIGILKKSQGKLKL